MAILIQASIIRWYQREIQLRSNRSVDSESIIAFDSCHQRVLLAKLSHTNLEWYHGILLIDIAMLWAKELHLTKAGMDEKQIK